MPFKKHMLLAYRPDCYTPLHLSGFPYILTVRVIRWWGLYDKIIEITIYVPPYVNAENFYEPKLNKWSR